MSASRNVGKIARLRTRFKIVHPASSDRLAATVGGGIGEGKWELWLAMSAAFWQGGSVFTFLALASLPTLKAQEIPFDHPDSCNMFRPGPDKPFLATPAAIEMYSNEVIIACWRVLRGKADEHSGVDYIQVFESDDHDQNLWFIEDGPGGAITALVPSDY